MKKFLVLAALVLVAATDASAQVLYREDLGWFNKNATTMETRIKARTSIATANLPDTTKWFSLIGCALPEQGKADGSNVDSTLIATIQFITDTTVAVTNDLTVCAYTVQGSNDGLNWEAVVPTVSYTGISSGDKGWGIPLWVKTSDGNGTAATKPNPLMRKWLRVVVASATGTQYAATPQLWFWSNDINKAK